MVEATPSSQRNELLSYFIHSLVLDICVYGACVISTKGRDNQYMMGNDEYENWCEF